MCGRRISVVWFVRTGTTYCASTQSVNIPYARVGPEPHPSVTSWERHESESSNAAASTFSLLLVVVCVSDLHHHHHHHVVAAESLLIIINTLDLENNLHQLIKSNSILI